MLRFILEQMTSAAAGYVLGLLSAAWLHGMWKLWYRPQQIRVWGNWVTRPNYMMVFGVALTIGWAIFFFISLD